MYNIVKEKQMSLYFKILILKTSSIAWLVIYYTLSNVFH